MSYVYLIRHAQAGTRDNYDVLSDLGREQARLLGANLAEQGIELDAVYCGGMRRQKETAEIACEALAGAGRAKPEIVSDERWNEFSLISVYRAIAKRMMDEDEAFALDIREMQQVIKADPHATGGAVGRCDQAVIRAWMEGRYPEFEGETWKSFSTRIQDCSSRLCSNNSHERSIAVFTSATPIAITAAAAMGLSEEQLLGLLGVIYNTSMSTLKVRDGRLRLFTFNATPHLPTLLRTFR